MEKRKTRVVALLTVRNEAQYLPRCLDHLYQQGIETCIIDNDSSDNSLEIAKSYMDKGVFRIERQPYKGYFDLAEQLKVKENLVKEIEADWFIHHDADEIMESCNAYETIQEALSVIDVLGYNVVNFDEFVFLPVGDLSYEGTDYMATMRHYYFFAPSELRLQRAWKKPTLGMELANFGGHQIQFKDKKIYPSSFRLRHYITLSHDHLLKKYGKERVYSRQEVDELGWHGARARFDPNKVRLPRHEELMNLDVDGWDRSCPLAAHPFFGE